MRKLDTFEREIVIVGIFLFILIYGGIGLGIYYK